MSSANTGTSAGPRLAPKSHCAHETLNGIESNTILVKWNNNSTQHLTIPFRKLSLKIEYGMDQISMSHAILMLFVNKS